MTKGQQSRAVILNSAKRLILERGFSSVTLQDILEAASVTKGRFFHHFATKEELFSELLRVALTSRTVLDFSKLAAQAPSSKAIDQLIYLLDRVAEWHEKGLPEEMRLCLLATFFFPLDSPEIARINQILSANAQVTESLIRQAQDEADFPKDLDPTVVSLLFPSTAVGSNLVGFLCRHERLTPTVVVEFCKMIKMLSQKPPAEGSA